jgi:hypothetical protein
MIFATASAPMPAPKHRAAVPYSRELAVLGLAEVFSSRSAWSARSLRGLALVLAPSASPGGPARARGRGLLDAARQVGDGGLVLLLLEASRCLAPSLTALDLALDDLAQLGERVLAALLAGATMTSPVAAKTIVSSAAPCQPP